MALKIPKYDQKRSHNSHIFKAKAVEIYNVRYKKIVASFQVGGNFSIWLYGLDIALKIPK